MQWYEMDRATRQAFLENQDRNLPGQNPGTGHWNYLRCAKYLQEWAEWNDGPPSRDALKETFVRERDCNGFGEHRAGLTPQEHPLFVPSDVLRVPDKLEFDVFLSHSSLDDNLCEDITVLLRNSDIRVFATPASIPTGKWEEQIEEALQNASTVWVLLTANVMSQSVWTHHEFGYFYGFRHGKGVDPRGDACRFLYSDPSYLRGLYGHIQGTQVASFEDPVEIARVIAGGLGKGLSIPSGWVPRPYPPSPELTQTPWPVRAGGPEFRLMPGFNGRELKLGCSFQITAQTQPGGVEYRWLGVGTDSNWATPMKENQPGKYQMKEIQLNPDANLEENIVTLEIRFWLEDGKQHGARWLWPLKPRGDGAWELRQESGSHVFQPRDGDWW